MLSLGVKVLTPPAAVGAHPSIALVKTSPKKPGSAFDAVATGVQAQCAVAFWTRNTTVSTKAGADGNAAAKLIAPKQAGRWAVTAKVSGTACEPITVKTYVRVHG